MCWITTPSAPPKLPLVHVAYAGSEFRPEAFNNLFLASLSTSNFRSMTATCSVFTALFPLLYLPCDGDQNLIKSWLEDHPQLSILTNPLTRPPPHQGDLWIPSCDGINRRAIKSEMVSCYLQGHPLGFGKVLKAWFPDLLPESLALPCSLTPCSAHVLTRFLPNRTAFSLSTHQMPFLIPGSLPVSSPLIKPFLSNHQEKKPDHPSHAFPWHVTNRSSIKLQFYFLQIYFHEHNSQALFYLLLTQYLAFI